MAHKKGVGSTDNGRDSNPKYLGVKLFGGQVAKAGNIIVRQRGTKYHAGENVYLSRDFTIHAKVAGTVAFDKRKNNRTYVSIIPADASATNGGAVAAAPKKEVKAAVAAPKTTTATAQGIASTTASKISFAGKKFSTDDLKIVEGIGPKIEELLHAGGIKTWNDLANATTERLQEILNEAGARYRVHNPSTWAKQAQLCVAGDWAELEALQDRLDGGVDRGA